MTTPTKESIVVEKSLSPDDELRLLKKALAPELSIDEILASPNSPTKNAIIAAFQAAAALTKHISEMIEKIMAKWLLKSTPVPNEHKTNLRVIVTESWAIARNSVNQLIRNCMDSSLDKTNFSKLCNEILTKIGQLTNIYAQNIDRMVELRNQAVGTLVVYYTTVGNMPGQSAVEKANADFEYAHQEIHNYLVNPQNNVVEVLAFRAEDGNPYAVRDALDDAILRSETMKQKMQAFSKLDFYAELLTLLGKRIFSSSGRNMDYDSLAKFRDKSVEHTFVEDFNVKLSDFLRDVQKQTSSMPSYRSPGFGNS